MATRTIIVQTHTLQNCYCVCAQITKFSGSHCIRILRKIVLQASCFVLTISCFKRFSKDDFISMSDPRKLHLNPLIMRYYQEEMSTYWKVSAPFKTVATMQYIFDQKTQNMNLSANKRCLQLQLPKFKISHNFVRAANRRSAMT